MSYAPEPTSEMGEYRVSVREESFFLRGASTWVWWRRISGGRMPAEGDEIEIHEGESRPDGDGWTCGHVARRHGIWVYPHGDSAQGQIEVRIEDIPKIRAALDLVERTHNGN